MLQREESTAKSNLSSRWFFFCKCWGHWHCHYLQITYKMSSQ